MSGKNESLKPSTNTISTKTSFEWSMKPIIILMTIFGQEMVINSVPTNHVTKKKPYSFRSFAIIIIGLTILVADIVINVISFIKISKVYLATGTKGVAGFVTVVFGHFFHDLMTIGIPLSFMIIRIFTLRWKAILSSLQMVQSEMNLPEKLHGELRKYAFFSIFLLLLVS